MAAAFLKAAFSAWTAPALLPSAVGRPVSSTNQRFVFSACRAETSSWALADARPRHSKTAPSDAESNLMFILNDSVKVAGAKLPVIVRLVVIASEPCDRIRTECPDSRKRLGSETCPPKGPATCSRGSFQCYPYTTEFGKYHQIPERRTAGRNRQIT